MSARALAADLRVQERLKQIPGVLGVESVSPDIRTTVVQLATPAAAENRGILEVFGRERVVCIFKNRSFRGPPDSTLVMMDDEGTLLGRELRGPEDRPTLGERRTVYLGRDFVLLTAVRPKGRVRFVLPAIRFPELEGIPEIRDVVSGSPDPPQDEELRRRFRMKGGKDVASILVGYNVSEATPAEPH